MQINLSQAKTLKYRLYCFRQCKSTYIRLKRSNIEIVSLARVKQRISGENAQISTQVLYSELINLSQAKTLKYRLYCFRQCKSTYLRLKRSNIDYITLGNEYQYIRLKRSNIDSIALGNTNQRISG